MEHDVASTIPRKCPASPVRSLWLQCGCQPCTKDQRTGRSTTDVFLLTCRIERGSQQFHLCVILHVDHHSLRSLVLFRTRIIALARLCYSVHRSSLARAIPPYMDRSLGLFRTWSAHGDEGHVILHMDHGSLDRQWRPWVHLKVTMFYI